MRGRCGIPPSKKALDSFHYSKILKQLRKKKGSRRRLIRSATNTDSPSLFKGNALEGGSRGIAKVSRAVIPLEDDAEMGERAYCRIARQESTRIAAWRSGWIFPI